MPNSVFALNIFRPAAANQLGCPVPNIRRLVLLAGIILVVTNSLKAVEDEAVFGNHCAACHGADGRARTPQGRKLKAKDLRESRLTDAEIFHLIREGSRQKTGVSVMPAVGRDMTEPEIEAVIRYVKTFRPSESTPK